MNQLLKCYQVLEREFGASELESFASAQLVEAYRQYWKPKPVRTILLAESHVFTRDTDRAIDIPVIEELLDYPREYAKFVYCLGYGEKELTKSAGHPVKDGTPHFWKVLQSCNKQINSPDDFANVLKKKTTFAKRLQQKISLLHALKEKGVWLVDVSIVALYGGREKMNLTLKKRALKSSWRNYTKSVVEECCPKNVIVIGKEVARAVEADLQEMPISSLSVIDQPNARLTADKHRINLKKYFSLCN